MSRSFCNKWHCSAAFELVFSRPTSAALLFLLLTKGAVNSFISGGTWHDSTSLTQEPVQVGCLRHRAATVWCARYGDVNVRVKAGIRPATKLLSSKVVC
eukprot:4677665-Amphidinium_carterae.2